MSVDCDTRTKLYAVQLMDVAMRRACVIVNGILIPKNMDPEQKIVQRVLLDIGAIGTSFIGANWIAQHSHLILKRESLPRDTAVTLADKECGRYIVFPSLLHCLGFPIHQRSMQQ